ncbi:hypothetical protein [Synechococcus elongatus]|uniref:Uncharacterized protein n=3 Tax=Synechococcus elongatus TaxID=32046 RepID=Q31RS4_SYNE7|nr:hypothetical protein [Synechococcus elongatus]AJD56705.1 hypothetical protein M744_01985 [Synechococcus elongatus UTEX 2973]MBD2588077.1 hypothetical protein [Synechococcus elongatus FACHB-242]UOW69995.1 hypothetical protein PCC7943_0219 [Synechococcus elongatus PCC 7943]UOW72716.1 hypothetical protein PCC6311_0219 [Synechococcus elongatus PCC 6311]ABB56245.1 hypothetical protein Synpcc7942_0213 [Synechococcus elongatus PCC 7942 = FACHB-805]
MTIDSAHPMQTIFDGVLYAHYRQAYIHIKGTYDFAENVRKGQVNGLLGAAYPTTLFLTFGLHSGAVRLSVKLASLPPDLDESWEEIVEAPFTMPETGTLGLSDWEGQLWYPIPIAPGSYRVRFSAQQFGEAEEVPESENDLNPIERYEVIFWPAARQPDQILKVTRPAAQYWHDFAQGNIR